MQLKIPGVRPLSIKSPIRYFGGKAQAVPMLIPFIPAYTNEVVSPFVGGASLELAMTGRGIRVYAYDAYLPVVNFWQCLQRYPNQLDDMICETIARFGEDRAALKAFAIERDGLDAVDAAHRFIICTNFTFNANLRSMAFAPYYIENGIPKRVRYTRNGVGDAMILNVRIRGFHNPRISFSQADFRESLANHPNVFAYLDPPYPASSAAYGDSPAYHEDFPHDILAEVLHDRKAGWVLSYKNCPIVRDLYPQTQFQYDYPKWTQGSKKLSNAVDCDEVIIRPKGQLPIRTIANTH